MDFLLEVGRFWGNKDTGVAEMALKLGVRLDETVILKCVGLCQFLRRGCFVVCRKLANFLVVFCGLSAEFAGKTELETGLDSGFTG